MFRLNLELKQGEEGFADEKVLRSHIAERGVRDPGFKVTYGPHPRQVVLDSENEALLMTIQAKLRRIYKSDPVFDPAYERKRVVIRR